MPHSTKLKRLAQTLNALPSEDDTPSPSPSNDLPIQLAREMVAALADELAQHRPTVPSPVAPFDPEYVNRKPIEDVSFFDLERLAAIDPAQSAEKWNEMAATAMRDIASGLHAARAVESYGRNAWQRATFKSLRKLLQDAWSPRDSLESMIVDQIVQYEMLRHRWLSVLSDRSRDPRTLLTMGDADERPARTLSAAQATKEALSMVERLQRLTHQAIRCLALLRDKKPAIFVNRLSQMNVTHGPQANVQNNDEVNSLRP